MITLLLKNIKDFVLDLKIILSTSFHTNFFFYYAPKWLTNEGAVVNNIVKGTKNRRDFKNSAGNVKEL